MAKKYSEAEMIGALKQMEAGRSAAAPGRVTRKCCFTEGERRRNDMPERVCLRHAGCGECRGLECADGEIRGV